MSKIVLLAFLVHYYEANARDKNENAEKCERHTKWLERITLAPFWIRCLMVGMAARILVSSVMFWLSSSGTLRSALTKTFFPFRSAALRSPTLFFAIDTTPLAPFPPLTAATRAATFAASSGSAAAKPRRRASGRERREEESCTREGEAEVAEEEEAGVVEWRREKVVGAAAEAIVERERECVWS